jgi:short-subunit dehydrogenase
VFAGKNVLVAGGSSGIGRQLALDFALCGARVAILAHDAEGLEAVRREIASISPDPRAYLCDLGDVAQIKRVASAYLADLGPPAILVNNAGYAVYRTFPDLTTDEIQRLLVVNFVSPFLLTREFLPSMIAAGSGHIVMMASIAGRVPMTPCGPYSAAKHGLVAGAETLRAELDRFGIGVHLVCPGRVEGTAFFAHQTFVERSHRRETRWTIRPEVVSRATLDAIRKNRFLTTLPRLQGPLVWLAHALPGVSRPLLQRLMRARVEDVYTAKASRRSTARDERDV